MKHDELHARLHFLAAVAQRESQHLEVTDKRIFHAPFTLARAETLATDVAFAEQVDAFVSRYGRLQDTVANKLLPTLLDALGEPIGAVVDNLDRAERLGWLTAVDDWLTARQLRNQMVHEYIEDLTVLSDALQAAHGYVPLLTDAARALQAEIEQRGW